MKLKNLILGIGITTFASGPFILSSSAYADNSGTSERVKKVELVFPGYAAVIHVKNVSANKLVSAVNLKAQESSMNFEVDGSVWCEQNTHTDFDSAKVYFGTVSLNASKDIDAFTTLYSEGINIEPFEWQGAIKKWGIHEYGAPQQFTVPLNQVKEAHPVLRVDPVAEINKLLQAHVQNGGKAVDFYKQDHEVVLQRPISLAGWCKKGSDKSAGFYTKNHTIQIKYEADPAVYAVEMNAQLQGNMPNQLTNDLPFKLDKADFQPNMPNYVGQCVPESNPKIRINFQTSGSTNGLIDMRIEPESNTYADLFPYYATIYGVANNPKNGASHVDFDFPLQELITADQYSYMLEMVNKTFNHNMRIKARFKPFNGGYWSDWKDYGTAVFKHRCTPQVAVPLGGQAGKIGGYNNGNDGGLGLKGTIQAQPVSPKPIDKLQAQPISPKPIDKVQARPQVVPDPIPATPTLKVQPQSIPTPQTPTTIRAIVDEAPTEPARSTR